MKGLNDKKSKRLEESSIIWISTVSSKLQPHLVPIWFVSYEDRIWCCTSGSSVKVANLHHNPSVAISLEDGSSPIIGQGSAKLLEYNYPVQVVSKFIDKYDWNITESEEYDILIEINIDRWLMN